MERLTRVITGPRSVAALEQTMHDRLRDALRAEGMADVEPILERVETAEDAERLRFVGSPTILVNGRDPFARGEGTFGLTCRVYETPVVSLVRQHRSRYARRCARPDPLRDELARHRGESSHSLQSHGEDLASTIPFIIRVGGGQPRPSDGWPMSSYLSNSQRQPVAC
jgi:hypothetical protein